MGVRQGSRLGPRKPEARIPTANLDPTRETDVLGLLQPSPGHPERAFADPAPGNSEVSTEEDRLFGKDLPRQPQ
jgi:hypothetical protein